MAGPVRRRKKPSLAEVARIAGVSISTVSKVANGGVDVSDATRERVERILAERGYVATRKRRGSLIPVELITRDMYNPLTLDVLRGIIDAAASTGLDISVSRYPDNAPDHRWIDEIHAAGRRGVIALTSILDDDERARFRSHGLEVVAIDPLNRPDESTTSVGATNWAGGLQATEHLSGLGHTKIAMLTGFPEAMASRARVSGFRAAMGTAGIELDESMVLDGDFTYDSGLELGTELLRRSDRPTAVFAASDLPALGVIEAARRLGLRVPEDLSVVGFDDLIMAQVSAPPLTTVRQPLDQMGAVAVQMIAALIADGPPDHALHTELATRLVVRGSTAPPAA